MAGAALFAVGCAGPTEGPANEPQAGHAAVVVTVHDVVGIAGGGLAGVLYEGREMLHERAVGGFGVGVDSDPFSITTTVKEPGRAFYGIFPYVSDETLLLEPGAYSLFVWADESPLTPYGRWAPAMSDSEPAGLLVCGTTFEVGDSDVRLSISGVPPEPMDRPIDPCTLD
ncbi:hypothetical protein [Agromyces bauzanensis]